MWVPRASANRKFSLLFTCLYATMQVNEQAYSFFLRLHIIGKVFFRSSNPLCCCHAAVTEWPIMGKSFLIAVSAGSFLGVLLLLIILALVFRCCKSRWLSATRPLDLEGNRTYNNNNPSLRWWRGRNENFWKVWIFKGKPIFLRLVEGKIL